MAKAFRALKYSICFLCISIFSIACYSPLGENYIEVEPDPVRELEGVSFFEMDTLYVRGQKSLSLNVIEENVLNYSIYVDTTLIESGDGSPNYISLNSLRFPDGVYDFTLVIALPASSGSLASQIGTEFSPYIISRKIRIDNSPLLPPHIIGFDIEDSTLRINWKAYSGYNFQSFTIRDYNNILKYTEDPKDTTFLIEDYSHGYINLTLDVRAKGEFNNADTSYRYPYKFNIDSSVKGIIELNWDRLPFRSTGGVLLRVKNNYIEHSDKFSKWESPKDGKVLFHIDLIPPYSYNGVEATLWSDNVYGGYEVVEKEQVLWRSNRVKNFSKPLFGKFIDSITYEYIYLETGTISAKAMSIVRSRLFLKPASNYDELIEFERLDNIYLSADQQLLLSIDGTTLNKLNKVTWEIEESLDIKELIFDCNKIYNLWLSNNGMVGVTYKDGNKQDDFVIIDLNTRTIKSTIGYGGTVVGYLSSDAKRVQFYSTLGYSPNGVIGYELLDPFNERILDPSLGRYFGTALENKLLFVTSTGYIITDYQFNQTTNISLNEFNRTSMFYDGFNIIYSSRDGSVNSFNILDNTMSHVMNLSTQAYGELFVDNKYVWKGDYFINRQ